ncbi:MAG TPA: hypothetical protein VMW94_08630 [Actinomycetes bacterium]|nr:hypothetical protein [Actinomycetes bacterium]
MTSILALMWPLALSLAAVLVVVATVRQVRGDRPVTPPGAPRDWRDEQMEWRRLGIS